MPDSLDLRPTSSTLRPSKHGQFMSHHPIESFKNSFMNMYEPPSAPRIATLKRLRRRVPSTASSPPMWRTTWASRVSFWPWRRCWSRAESWAVRWTTTSRPWISTAPRLTTYNSITKYDNSFVWQQFCFFWGGRRGGEAWIKWLLEWLYCCNDYCND